MLIDHMGMVLLPEYTFLRIIGRLAMPLFCLLIAYGSIKTRSLFKYFLRLFVFAVISQIWLDLVISGNVLTFDKLNVFFTLSLGVLSVWLIKKSPNFVVAFIYVLLLFFAVMTVMVFVQLDYDIAGILLIILFYLGFKLDKFIKDKKYMARFLNSKPPLFVFKVSAVFSLLIFNLLLYILSNWGIQWFSMFAVLVIVFFADKKLSITKAEKYAFYLFYPVHLGILYLLKPLMG